MGGINTRKVRDVVVWTLVLLIFVCNEVIGLKPLFIDGTKTNFNSLALQWGLLVPEVLLVFWWIEEKRRENHRELIQTIRDAFKDEEES